MTTGLSPKDPTKYVGPVNFLSSVVNRNRQPTGADYRQPETGKLYPVSSFWLVGANPTTGTQGELWYLSKIVANVAYWLMLSSGSAGPVVRFDIQSSTAPGTDPVFPTAMGAVTVNGAVVANHAVVLETHSRAANTFNVEVQYAGSAASTTGNLSGVSHYNNTQFSVDANGFVSLLGGGLAIDSIQVDAFTAPGTNPVLPTVAGLMTVTGALVAAGSNPVRSNSLAASSYQIQVQTSQALAAADSTKVGLSNFNSAQFTVSAGGFVSLIGSGTPAFTRVVRQVFTGTGTYTPTVGMLYADAEVIGGGGGGGGCANAAAGNGGAAGGGGAGGYARGLFTAATIGVSKAVTIGAGGAGGTNAPTNGSSGGTTSLGALLSATGGSGGSGSGTMPAAQITGGAFGGVGTGGDYQATGGVGEWGINILAGVNAAGGSGGSSILGGNGGSSPGGAGGAGTTYGVGGGGAAAIASGSGGSGGAGAAGLVIVTEYCS